MFPFVLRPVVTLEPGRYGSSRRWLANGCHWRPGCLGLKLRLWDPLMAGQNHRLLTGCSRVAADDKRSDSDMMHVFEAPLVAPALVAGVRQHDADKPQMDKASVG